jgi:tetratricopeptide (TPR) repeat protein
VRVGRIAEKLYDGQGAKGAVRKAGAHLMVKGSGRVALALLLATLSTQGVAQQGRSSPPGREAAIFEFLMAEVAAQRGETAPAIASLVRLARELRDPQVARRAVELAIRARNIEAALDAGALLVELEPESNLGRDLIASLVTKLGGVDKAREAVAGLVEASTDKALLLTQLAYFFGKYPDKEPVLEATRVIVSRYPALPESRYAVGVAALVAGRLDLARTESLAALAMRPDWPQAAILHAQVLRKESPDQVIPYYRAFVERNPAAKDVRLQLAREYAAGRRNADAREEFRAVEMLAPTDAQAPYAIGLLDLQMEDAADADAAFRRALAKDYPETAAVHLGLGQAAEMAKRYDEAIEWYGKVDSSDRMRAQTRIAALIAKRDGLAKGRDYLKTIESDSPDDRIQVFQIEAQLLRDAKAWNETFDLLTKAVAQFPDSVELLYDQAMAAERVDRLDILESNLRRVIELKPDYAHAYNALGYTLADRTDRLEEAFTLIGKALVLSPEDPFILDSLGWVQYRRGNFEEALKHLKSAYTVRRDPEIAAHLGEVLWKLDQRDEARKIWQAALTDNPGHESLISVIQKFKP